ncbi:MAG TPA: FtsX-like permease family protein, partial [Pseudoneobacillus sp.]|nr:FtsX-like permease family protein [Pseudoneobacillus sp.]
GLIFNTISAIMISQRRQIGVMKVIGASFMDIILMYMRIVAIVGIIALVWGIPISLWTSRVLIQKSVDLLNFDTDILKPSFKVIILQVWVSLLMPLLVAVFPIFLQGKEPIANAIKGHSFHTFGVSWIDNVLHKFTGLPRPLLLSLRNSFRRKGRLFLTVITLSIGGSMVLSVFSIKYSIQDTVEKTLGYANYDIQYLLPSFDEGKKIEQSLREIKEIKKIDTAIESFSTMVRDDHTKTMELYLLGVNPSTSFNKPTIIKGRWLSDTRTNEIVVNQMLLRNEKNIKIGDFIKLNINGKESNWKVAGFAAIPRRIDFFVSYKAISNLLDRNERINVLQVQIKNEEQVNVSKLGLKIKNQLLSDGFTIESPIMMKDLVKKEESRSEIIVILLFGMTGLICVIAGLGLMGTMSLSVIERKQEIGIMRSIGASNQNIWWILIVEAMIIGFISSCIAAILAFPISKVLSNHIGENLFETPLFFVYPLSGIIYWMIIALILSVIASLLPAWRATRISVKDVLNYE